MIQRIQTLWLVLAAIVMALLFYFPVYMINGTAVSIGNNFIAIVLAALSIILSLVTLFSFKKRKNQVILTWLNILVCVLLLGWLFYLIHQNKIPETLNDGYYWVGAFIPLVDIVLLFLAKRGIRKDEKLVKSLDRLR
jgi:peptidoglycan/LPS O-acetylase OafA/YrhL